MILNNRPGLSLLSLTLLGFALWATSAPAQSGKSGEKENGLSRMQQFLEKTAIETKHFKEEMPFSRFLEVLEKQLPKDKKIVIQIHKDSFGKMLPKIAATTVVFPVDPKDVPKMNLLNILGVGVSAVREALEIDIDFGIEPGRVLVTTTQHAVYPHLYDVGDLVQDLPEAKASEVPWVLRLVYSSLEPRSWEKFQLHNGTVLNVQATPTRHGEIGSYLAALRRSMDVAVVMNARLYEVDRAFFAKDLAPLLMDGKEKIARPLAPVAHDSPALKKLGQEKVLVKSPDARVRGFKATPFLSLQEVFEAKLPLPDPKNEGRPLFDTPLTGLRGVSFLARVQVSADRRFLRLEITQKVHQPGEIQKIKFGAKDIGFEELDNPTGQTTTLTATVTIPDGVGILMPVNYQLPGEKDRVWVLYAEPRILIQEEEDAIKKGLKKAKPRRAH